MLSISAGWQQVVGSGMWEAGKPPQPFGLNPSGPLQAVLSGEAYYPLLFLTG
jgi:hypothetical protein